MGVHARGRRACQWCLSVGLVSGNGRRWVASQLVLACLLSPPSSSSPPLRRGGAGRGGDERGEGGRERGAAAAAAVICCLSCGRTVVGLWIILGVGGHCGGWMGGRLVMDRGSGRGVVLMCECVRGCVCWRCVGTSGFGVCASCGFVRVAPATSSPASIHPRISPPTTTSP